MKNKRISKYLGILFSGLFVFSMLFTGCEQKDNNKTGEALGSDIKQINIASSSVIDGKLLTVCAADCSPNDPRGENKSPEVKWEAVDGAKYYALAVFDETANWLHSFVTDITDTEIELGRYTDTNEYIGPYPPKSSGAHSYRIEIFAIKEKPEKAIGKMDGKNSYDKIINELNQVGGSNNIIARGHIIATYQNGDNNVEK